MYCVIISIFAYCILKIIGQVIHKFCRKNNRFAHDKLIKFHEDRFERGFLNVNSEILLVNHSLQNL